MAHAPRLSAGVAVTVLAALAAVGAAVALWPAAPDPLEVGCDALGPGDTLSDAFVLLGTADFLPGCGRVAPCETTWPTADGPVGLSCTADDCSQQWRRGPVICFVEADVAGTIQQVSLRIVPL